MLMCTYKFVACLYMLYDVVHTVAKLQGSLQSKVLDLATVPILHTELRIRKNVWFARLTCMTADMNAGVGVRSPHSISKSCQIQMANFPRDSIPRGNKNLSTFGQTVFSFPLPAPFRTRMQNPEKKGCFTKLTCRLVYSIHNNYVQQITDNTLVELGHIVFHHTPQVQCHACCSAN